MFTKFDVGTTITYIAQNAFGLLVLAGLIFVAWRTYARAQYLSEAGLLKGWKTAISEKALTIVMLVAVFIIGEFLISWGIPAAQQLVHDATCQIGKCFTPPGQFPAVDQGIDKLLTPATKPDGSQVPERAAPAGSQTPAEGEGGSVVACGTAKYPEGEIPAGEDQCGNAISSPGGATTAGPTASQPPAQTGAGSLQLGQSCGKYAEIIGDFVCSKDCGMTWRSVSNPGKCYNR